MHSISTAPSLPSVSPWMSAYSLHPTHSSWPPLCRMELTGSRLSSQDQQPKGPNCIPMVFTGTQSLSVLSWLGSGDVPEGDSPAGEPEERLAGP